MKILYRFTTSVLVCSLLLLPLTANAHKLRIFAWSEGDVIYGETAFSGNRKPKNAEIVVQEAKSHAVLLTTRTDDQGKFHFTIPQKASQEQLDLLLIGNAGEGHRGEWHLPAAEYLSLSLLAEPEGGQRSAPPATAQISSSADQATIVSVDEQLLRRIVDEELEKKLAPLKHMLAENSQKVPDLQDILGGIGYILGLAGIFAWLQAENPKKRSNKR